MPMFPAIVEMRKRGQTQDAVKLFIISSRLEPGTDPSSLCAPPSPRQHDNKGLSLALVLLTMYWVPCFQLLLLLRVCERFPPTDPIDKEYPSAATVLASRDPQFEFRMISKKSRVTRL